jgi:hypothetical protein
MECEIADDRADTDSSVGAIYLRRCQDVGSLFSLHQHRTAYKNIIFLYIHTTQLYDQLLSTENPLSPPQKINLSTSKQLHHSKWHPSPASHPQH